MITALHAGFVSSAFVLWAERSFDPDAPVSGLAEGTHPFAAPVRSILRAFDELGTPLASRKGEAAEARITVWLPTIGGRPVPSTPLLGHAPLPTGECELRPWSVPSVTVAPSELLDVLVAGDDRAEPVHGLLRGADYVFWYRAFRFVAELAAEGLYLPGLRVEGEAAQSNWEWIELSDQREPLALLAASMPASARALGTDESGGPPSIAPEFLLRAFIAEALDRLVRDAVQVSPGLRPASLDRHPPKVLSLHERWLRALTSGDRPVDATPVELRALDDQIRAWRRPLHSTRAAPYKLHFELREPAAVDGTDTTDFSDLPWTVHFGLQSALDPSVVHTAQEVWAGSVPLEAVPGTETLDPRLLLRHALERAAEASPSVRQCLGESHPTGFPLDAVGAHEFLVRGSHVLERAGFSVSLQSWWHAPRHRLSARARVTRTADEAARSARTGIRLGDLVHVDWEIALGDLRIDRGELEELARSKVPLVQLRGRWVELPAKELESAIDFWNEHGADPAASQMSLREVIDLTLGARRGPANLPVTEVEAADDVETVLGRLQGDVALEERTPPAGFVGTLRPYQLRGFAWLAFLRDLGLGACLADDMGLGKTIQALALFQWDRERGEDRPVLLACPTSVLANWQRESARFTPALSVLVHHGAQRRSGDDFVAAAARADLVVTSYSLLPRDRDDLARVRWAGLVLDEAQNIKNPDTKQARSARAIPAEYRMALTGTPVENHVGDLWSLMEFLVPGLLGSRGQFRDRFFLPIQTRRDKDTTNLLQRMTRPFVLRRLKTDRDIVKDLPEKIEQKVYCTLTEEQAALYQAVLADAEDSLEASSGIQRRGVVLALISKLKQICNHPAHFLGDRSEVGRRSGKLVRLVEMLDEALSVGDRALVFTQFTEMGEILHTYLEEHFGKEVLYLHGGLSKNKRDELVERFQGEDGPPIFLLSLRAAGTGLNLTAANHVFHFDRWWNPAVEDQATDRAFRIGQTRNVQVHKMICAGTMEDSVDALIERKKDVAENVVGAGEGWLTELSSDELREVLALRAEALEVLDGGAGD